MEKPSFRVLFFRYYDRKIADGTITFSQVGISKNDFTKLCTEADFVPDMEVGGSLAAAKEKGFIRSEGKEYVMNDGDVVNFLFNV